MVSWFKYIPSQEFARLRMPALIVQGTTDIQVGAEQAALLHKANPASRLLMVDGANHLLKQVPADTAQQMASYSNPVLPLAPAVSGAAIDFIQGLPQRACR
jgi:pimeloyl-ACP methyl ester carboxylesterase